MKTEELLKWLDWTSIWPTMRTEDDEYYEIRALIEHRPKVTISRLLEFSFQNSAESDVAKIYRSAESLLKEAGIEVEEEK